MTALLIFGICPNDCSSSLGLLHRRRLLRLPCRLEFPSIMMLQIARRKQLMLDEDCARNGDLLRQYIQGKCNELFPVSFREIGYRTKQA